MNLTFRQGIVSYPNAGGIQQFLSRTGNYVTMDASSGITYYTIAQGSSNYLLAENLSTPNAWGPLPSGVDTWIYWSINPSTGERSFGFTLLAPVSSTTAPLSPVPDQHWFDRTARVMKVWSGAMWQLVLRVFAANVNDAGIHPLGSISGLMFAGTQVGISSVQVTAGEILADSTGRPIRKTQSGELVTTSDDFFVNGSPITTFKLDALVLTREAGSNIAQYNVVALQADSTVLPAGYDDVGHSPVCLATVGAVTGDPVTMSVQGVITNPAWSWATVGAKLWVTVGGALTDIDPHVIDASTYPHARQPVAYVVAVDQIYFDQGLGGVGDTGPAGDSGSGATNPATTIVPGIARLSYAALDSEDPVVVATTDPRMANARTPTAHTHPSTQVDTTNLTMVTGATLDLQLSAIDGFISALNTSKLAIAGGNMLGSLLLHGAPVQPLEAATKQYVDDLGTAVGTELDNLDTEVNNLTIAVSTKQPHANNLDHLAALSGAGLVAMTSGAAVQRSVVGQNGISAANGDGVAGDPTVGLTSQALRSFSDGSLAGKVGFLYRPTDNSTITKTLDGTLGQITITDNGSDHFIIAIDSDYAAAIAPSIPLGEIVFGTGTGISSTSTVKLENVGGSDVQLGMNLPGSSIATLDVAATGSSGGTALNMRPALTGVLTSLQFSDASASVTTGSLNHYQIATERGPAHTTVIFARSGDIVIDTSSNNSVDSFRVDASSNVIVGTAALDVNASDGFLYIPTMPGAPTNAPTAYPGRSPIVVNTLDNKLHAFDPIDSVWIDIGGLTNTRPVRSWTTSALVNNLSSGTFQNIYVPSVSGVGTTTLVGTMVSSATSDYLGTVYACQFTPAHTGSHTFTFTSELNTTGFYDIDVGEVYFRVTDTTNATLYGSDNRTTYPAITGFPTRVSFTVVLVLTEGVAYDLRLEHPPTGSSDIQIGPGELVIEYANDVTLSSDPEVEPKINGGLSSQFWTGDKHWHTLVQQDIIDALGYVPAATNPGGVTFAPAEGEHVSAFDRNVYPGVYNLTLELAGNAFLDPIANPLPYDELTVVISHGSDGAGSGWTLQLNSIYKTSGISATLSGSENTFTVVRMTYHSSGFWLCSVTAEIGTAPPL